MVAPLKVVCVNEAMMVAGLILVLYADLNVMGKELKSKHRWQEKIMIICSTMWIRKICQFTKHGVVLCTTTNLTNLIFTGKSLLRFCLKGFFSKFAKLFSFQRALSSTVPWVDAVRDVYNFAQQPFEGCSATIFVHFSRSYRRPSVLYVQLES